MTPGEQQVLKDSMKKMENMPKSKKDDLLKQLSAKIDSFNSKSKRKLFLDSITGALGGGGGLAAAGLGAGAGMAMATMGEEAERLELQRLEGELRSMKFRMMMKMSERGQEISNLEVKVKFQKLFIQLLGFVLFVVG